MTRVGDVIFCEECGKPWGARGHGQADALVDAYHQWWADRWDDDTRGTPHAGDPVPPTGVIQPPENTHAVFVTEASARWLDEIGIDVGVEAGCWYRHPDHDLPAWWAEPRLQPFTSWDCCSLPDDPWDAAGLYEEMVP